MNSPLAQINGYEDSLKIAYETLQNEANKNQTIKWEDGSDMELFGEKLTMFKATEKQFNNSKLLGDYAGQLPSNYRTTLDDLGKGAGVTDGNKAHTNEIISIIHQSANRQNNQEKLERDYYTKTGTGEVTPVVYEDFLLGAGKFVRQPLKKVIQSGAGKLSAGTREFGIELDYVIRGVGSDIKAGATVLGNATKTGVNKAINLTNSYLNKTTKAMAEQPIKVALGNGVATGGVTLGFEGYDYATGKPLTKENLLNSANDILYTTGLATVTSNMPLGATIGATSLGDRLYKGNANLKDNVLNTTKGNFLEKGLDKTGVKGYSNIIFREIFLKLTEDKKDEK